MSSRQRRLVEKSKDALVAQTENGTEECEDVVKSMNAYSNPYSLLGEEDEDEEKSESHDEDNDGSEINPVVESEPLEKAVNKKKKKKQRRQRGQSKKKNAQKPEELEDLDRVISELRINADQPNVSDASLLAELPKDSILGVDIKSLKGDEELARIFGASVIANVEAELEKKRRRELGMRDRGSTRTTQRFLKRFILTNPHPDWKVSEPLLTMESKGKTEEGEMFEFVGSAKYWEDHNMFLLCQDLGDPNSLAAFSNKNPFHVESLLAMHDLLLSTGQALHAEECLKRALFILELSWHSNFSPFSGKCLLNYKVECNKSFFKALFRHVQQLNKRGCVQTAFEACKFLLSLDVTDPLGALCMLDYLSIRAGKYQFVSKLVNEYKDGLSLAIRPGIAFSLALAKLEMGEESMENLVQVILMHPLSVVRMMGKLNDKGVVITPEWQSILKNKFFAQANDGGSASLNHLVNLFVERHHMLYKPLRILEWLKEGCLKALILKEKSNIGENSDANDWECVRVNFFAPGEQNEFQSLRLYDFSDEVLQFNEDILQMGGGVDDAEVQMVEQLERQRGAGPVVQLTDEDLRQANPLLIFLQSLLPWVQRDSNA